MEINKSQANINPVDLKSPGYSALQEGSKNRTKDSVVSIAEVKRQEEVKRTETAAKQKDVNAEAVTKAEAETEDLSSAIAKISEHIQNVQRDLVFSVDEESGRNVVTIKDARSDEVIRQYPSEEILSLARNLSEQLDEGDKEKTVSLFSSTA
ncbi:MAG: hypothetical protein GQ532_16015 [Methylomarinum sp.]|nr:hypothetical protein [Methylomarinum sp.]